MAFLDAGAPSRNVEVPKPRVSSPWTGSIRATGSKDCARGALGRFSSAGADPRRAAGMENSENASGFPVPAKLV